MRPDGRSASQMRPVTIHRSYTGNAPGSVLIELGRTRVLCTASVEQRVPGWLVNRGHGWVTAEYGMLPGSTPDRKPRERFSRVDGRSIEIQRLIGRSLRIVTELELLGERTVWVDCDVLEADGGTRTAAITAAWIALRDATEWMRAEGMIPASPLRGQVAGISVGIVSEEPLLDLCYEEDSGAEVDLNLICTDRGLLVEVQGTAESKPFSDEMLQQMLALGRRGIEPLFQLQRTDSRIATHPAGPQAPKV